MTREHKRPTFQHEILRSADGPLARGLAGTEMALVAELVVATVFCSSGGSS